MALLHEARLRIMQISRYMHLVIILYIKLQCYYHTKQFHCHGRVFYKDMYTKRSVSVAGSVCPLFERGSDLNALIITNEYLRGFDSPIWHNATPKDTTSITSSVSVCVCVCNTPTSPFCAALSLTPISLQ